MNMKKQVIGNKVSKNPSGIFSNFPLGNKKIMNIVLLLIFLVSIVSFSVNAAPRFIEAGLRPIEDFFGGGWQNYEKTIVFLVFFFLIYSAFLIGVKKAFSGEMTRSHIVFAFVAAFLSAFIITTTMDFGWINLEYVAWGLIGVLILFLIHSLLLKLGMENKKFWAFILALLITALLLWGIWYLMNEGRPLSGMGRFSDWFGTLGDRVSGIGDEGDDKSDLWPDGPPLGEGEEGAGVVGGGKGKGLLVGGGGIGLIIIIIAIVLMRKRGGRGVRKVEETVKDLLKKELPKDLNELIQQLNILSKTKKEIQKFMSDIEKKKNKLVKKVDLKKVIETGGMQKFVDETLTKEDKELMKEEKALKKLFELDVDLEHYLHSLNYVEYYIIQHRLPSIQYAQMVKNQNILTQLNKEISGLKIRSEIVLRIVSQYFELEEMEKKTIEQIKHHIDKATAHEKVKEQWIANEEKLEQHLKKVTDEESKAYLEISHSVGEEKTILDDVIRILKKELGEQKSGKTPQQAATPGAGSVP